MTSSNDRDLMVDDRAAPLPGEELTGGRARFTRVRSALRSDAVSSFATVGAFFIILVVVYGTWLGGHFLASSPRAFDVYQNVPPLIIGAGIVICLACGRFDLSVGAMASLSVFMTIGLRTKEGLPFISVLFIVLAIGVVVGLVNALLVQRFRINAFLATLATGGILDGVYTVYGGGTDVAPVPGSPNQLPSWFTGIHSFGSFQVKVPLVVAWVVLALLLASAFHVARDRFVDTPREKRNLGLVLAVMAAFAVFLALARFPQQMSWGIFALLVLYWIVWVALRFTRFGRGLYAIGGNEVAARLSGIKVNLSITVAYVSSGLLAALAGIILAANQGSASPQIADGYLLPAYAAAFLSTVIISTGRFHIWGTLVGGICVVYISQGLVLGGVTFTWTDVINGAVLIIAVGVSTTLRRAVSR